MFDLSKFMVGSDRESVASAEEGPVSQSGEEGPDSQPGVDGPPPHPDPASRPNSFSPPAKPPRIYDTPEGEDDVVYNDPVDAEEKQKEELYESPVWSSSEIQSLAEQGRTHPGNPITIAITLIQQSITILLIQYPIAIVIPLIQQLSKACHPIEQYRIPPPLVRSY